MKRIVNLLLLVMIATAANAQAWSKALEKSAKRGNIEAQVNVAKAYHYGLGINQDLDKAAKWYFEAVKQGNEEAKVGFYSFYSKLLEKYAKKGDAQAQYEVGCDYLAGIEVSKDIKKAAEWLLKSVDQGYAPAEDKFYSFYSKELEKRAKSGDTRAQFELGNCYLTAKEVNKDTKEAAEWYLKAMSQGHEGAKDMFYSFYSKKLEKRAKEGDARAQFEIGNCYLQAKEVEKDTEEAADWFLKAMTQGYEGAKEKFYSFYSKKLEKKAKEGDAEAQYEVGNCYLNAKDVKRDIEEAAEWYLKSMTQGHEGAKTMFYSFYSKKLEKRAKDKDAQAQYELGNFYFAGKGVEKDTETAAEWYLKALEQGHEGAKEKFYSFYSKELEKRAKKGDAEAQYQIGNGYLEGLRVKRDTETAAEWFLKAMRQNHEGAKEKFYSFYSKELEKRAKGGDARAQYETGNCYFNGNIVKKDNDTAAEWYLKAMLQNHEDAKAKFYSFYSKELLKRAKSGDAEAQFQVGNSYYTGTGTKIDTEEAAEWYLEAKTKGHEGAAEKFYSYYSKVLDKASKKDVEALYRMGCFYMDGKTVEKNTKKSSKMLLEAHEQGHPEAFNKFASVYSKDLEKMAKKGDVRARIAMAKCYINGSGIEKSSQKAADLLRDLTGDAEFGAEATKLLESIEK